MERGNPRGEFITLQCQLAKWPCECDSEERVYYEEECRCNERQAIIKRIFEIKPTSESCVLGIEKMINQRCWQRYRYWRGFIETISLSQYQFIRRAKGLFKTFPLLEIAISNRDPHFNNGKVWWYTNGPDEAFDAPWYLNYHLFDKLAWGMPQDDDRLPLFRIYENGETAREDLSNACVALGREFAGLPTIPPPFTFSLGASSKLGRHDIFPPESP